jgi:hypothetical protein
MTKPNIQSQRSRTVALIAALLVPTALWAQSEGVTREARNASYTQYTNAVSAPTRAACDKAKSDAQFLRQMQLTDGDANPFVQLPIRADCRNVAGGEGKMASRESTERAQGDRK